MQEVKDTVLQYIQCSSLRLPLLSNWLHPCSQSNLWYCLEIKSWLLFHSCSSPDLANFLKVLSLCQTLATLLGTTCWVRLTTMLKCVATSWVLLTQVWKWSFCMQHMWMARFMQQYCTRAYALVQFSTCNMLQHVTTWWPNARNMFHPTMLRYVMSKSCDRLAGALVFHIQMGS